MVAHSGTLINASVPARNPWLMWPRPNSRTGFQLVCIPYAGGSAHIFNSWPKHLPDFVRVCAVQLPGRGRRIKEPSATTLTAIAQPLAEALAPHLGKRFAFFGHSMGALISFEVMRELRKVYKLEASHLFVSGCFAPQIPDPHPLHRLPDREFLAEINRLEGVPRAGLESVELMQLMLPTLRADCLVTEAYVYQDDMPFECPITTFGGLEDHIGTQEYMAQWRKHTKSSFSQYTFPGKHFFFDAAESSILQIVSRDIDKVLTAPASI
jgi:medium-chain acyl-[acyl-carrier-protein] hydrolase